MKIKVKLEESKKGGWKERQMEGRMKRERKEEMEGIGLCFGTYA